MLRTPVGDTRLRILAWLREPLHDEHGRRGATADAVAAHFGLPLPVAVTHLRLLTSLGLLHSDTGTDAAAGPPHYRRDEVRIAQVARMLEKGW